MERKIHKIDATGQVLGRMATKIATLLRGKNKPTFVPNLDNGGFVHVDNIAHMKVTGKKMTDKIYYRHTGYPGGLRKTTMKELWEKKGPAEVLKRAVYNMLPKNKLRKDMMKRLKIT